MNKDIEPAFQIKQNAASQSPPKMVSKYVIPPTLSVKNFNFSSDVEGPDQKTFKPYSLLIDKKPGDIYGNVQKINTSHVASYVEESL